jgi:hypothetical protein
MTDHWFDGGAPPQLAAKLCPHAASASNQQNDKALSTSTCQAPPAAADRLGAHR